MALLRNSELIDGARCTIATQMRKLSRKLGAPFAVSAKMFWRLAGPDGILLCPEDILDKAKWKDLTVVAFVARKPVPWKGMILLGWKGHKITIPEVNGRAAGDDHRN